MSSAFEVQDLPMPIHDWSRVDAGIFHHFRLVWICALSDAFNQRLLSDKYYSLVEHHGARFRSESLALEGGELSGLDEDRPVRNEADANLEFYRRKQDVATVRYVAGDRLVAVVDIVSPGNKFAPHALEDFVSKTAEYLNRNIPLLIVDLQSPGAGDPQGIHGAIWSEMTDQEYLRPADKPLTLAAYDADNGLRAFVEPVAVGDLMIEMPLFLASGRYVAVPLEETYMTAYNNMPWRWRRVLEAE